MNGDILTNLDYSSFYDFHLNQKSTFTISSYKRIQAVDYGVLETENSCLSAFKEKPKINFEVSMGIYMLNKSILNHIPSKKFYGFDTLMHDLLKKKVPVTVKPFDGYWLDIGRPDDYEKAINEFEVMENEFLHNTN